MTSGLVDKIRRGLKKSPRYIVERLLTEAHGQAERYVAPRRARGMTAATLLRRTGYTSIDAWWQALAKRPFVAQTAMKREDLERVCPGEAEIILADARKVLAREVDLLGSGPVQLGTPVDWTKDYKTGHAWPNAYCRDIAYNNLERSSDVKFPWEVSRMQWLMPAGQAYALSGDERYAVALRVLIDEWISANPYASSVNWACTMDVALRAMTWTWLFHVFHASAAWADTAFRARFLQSLYLHGDFTQRHLEKSDINGNHYTADAAGLVFLGLFFGGDGAPRQWQELGWQILQAELPLQVFEDGVDFEASVPYHRLVQELFLLPALYRLRCEMDVAQPYRQRLKAMAEFTAAYSRDDGSVPLWGDADDARALPFKQKPINDHRYLLSFAALTLDEPSLLTSFSGSRAEALWIFGADVADRLPDRDKAPDVPRSQAFPHGGFYVMRRGNNHVFIDCGPLGLGDRGGHGHNDLLSFEAVLDGVHLVIDCGAYLYTASMTERNNFRSTGYHNTPRIDGEEINRFIRPDYLWSFHNDAAHRVDAWAPGDVVDRIEMSHTGYAKLASPVTVARTIALDHAASRLTIADQFDGVGVHTVEVPLHLAPNVRVTRADHYVTLEAQGRSFVVTWSQKDAWTLAVEPARVSPTYGVVVATSRLVWQRTGDLKPLTVTLEPQLIARGVA